jgi:hypothetical protein
MPTAVLFLTSDSERQSIFDKVEQGLALIQRYAPLRFAQVKRDISCIFVCGDASTFARYVRDLRMCEFFINYVRSPDTSAASIASTLVHEATHARLYRLKVGAQAEQHRLERACYHAERVFCRRLPGEPELVQSATTMMAADPTTYSAAAQVERQVAALRQLGNPRWVAECVAFWLRWRAGLAIRSESGRHRPTRS